MQKVLKRSLLARNQALRSQRTQSKKRQNVWAAQNKQRQFERNRVLCDEVLQERQGRRIDWDLGPLAPRRDVGEAKESYGTRPLDFSTPLPVRQSMRQKYFNFVVNDRVCVVRGPERGKIGKVLSVDKGSQTLKVSDVNRVDLRLHKFQRQEGLRKAPFVPEELPISIDDVRLVVTIKESTTGEAKEVIVKDMYASGPKIKRPPHSRLPTHTRYITGFDMAIPWPDETIYKQPTHKSDTTRYHVEHETFLPSIQAEVLPPGAIDELRNAYGKYRTDYEEEYVMRRLMEDMKQSHKKQQKLVTPQSQFWEKEVEEKAKKRPTAITEDTSVLIAKVQALSLKPSPEASAS